MKKILALVLVLSMVLGSFGFAFAATTAETNAGQALKNLGVLKGDAQGNLMLDTVLKRQDIIVLLSRLMGAEEEASKFPIPSAYTDITDAYYKTFIGWAQVEGLTEGIGENKFGFDQELTVKELATFLLRALGHENAWDKAETLAVELGLVAAGANFEAKASRGVMAAATLEALSAPLAGDESTSLGSSLGFAGFELEEEVVFGVKSVKANTAKSFQVEFTTAAENTADVKISAKRGTTAATLTTTWNVDKTVATLEASAKLAEGIYTVTVEGFGEYKVEIEKEKIASVEFDSDVIVRINDEEGIVGYVVKNQYGENITDGALGRGLDWIVSTNKGYTRDTRVGVLTVKHEGQVFNQLKDLKSVVVTVRDISTGFVQTKTFGVSETVAVISDIKLLGIVDEKGNEVDFVFDQTKTYYLDFEATDVNGKQMDIYAALNAYIYRTYDANGAVTNPGTKVLDIRSSNDSIVSVSLDRHPDNNSKGVFRIQLAGSITYDTPVSFIAMAPFSGKTATLNTTLRRSARVESFALQSPAETVSVDRSVEIPFTALDQNGNAVTKFEDLDGNITFSPAANVGFVRQSDGTAKLFAKFPNKTIYYVTATVNGSLSGSFSQISIDVKEATVATSIQALRHTRAYTTGGSMKAELSEFAVKDQYDRDMNLQTDGNGYRVIVTSLHPAVVQVNNGTLVGNTDAEVEFVGMGSADSNYGTATITYTLEKFNTTTSTWVYVDSASTIAYNVNPKDIKGATISKNHTRDLYVAGEAAIYGDKTAPGTFTALGNRMRTEVTMYGVLDNQMEVRLPASMVSVFTTTNKDFSISGKQVKVLNIGNATTASTTVTGYVYDNTRVLTASTEIKASTAAPAPTAVVANYENSFLRAADVDNDVITLDDATFNAMINGKTVIAFNKLDGSDNNVAPLVRAGVRFQVNTQYGMTNSGIVERVLASTVNSATTPVTITVNQNTGEVSVSRAVVAGDEFLLTAIAANGTTKSITIKIQ